MDSDKTGRHVRYCPSCGERLAYKSKSSLKRANKQGSVCLSCSTVCKWNNKKYRDSISASTQKLWEDPIYKEKRAQSIAGIADRPGYRKKISESSKKLWKDPEYRETQKKHKSDPKYLKKASKLAIDLWKDPDYREAQIKSHNSDLYKERMAYVLANRPKVSNIQAILYGILDDLEIEYYREHNNKEDDQQCKIGPWTFDCVIPREGNTNLLIECQGNYWHSLPKVKMADEAKASYIYNNFSDYEIKYLWEHEFGCRDKVVELIKYWTGQHKYHIVKFDFGDVAIKRAPASDYKPLFEKYHYLSSTRPGSYRYGGYVGDDIAAAAIFSSPVRQNISIGYKFLELSRFVIHPRYQKKNFGSWFISRTIKDIKNSKPEIAAIVSYCDTTFNHHGALYKALNFVQDAVVRPDYWYVSDDGWVMHKKTLYNRAIKMSMTEKEFAEAYGYTKVFGKEKLRFVYRFK